MKKAMKQLFQKGISGLLCVAMILTSLSIPEMTAYAAETEISDEMETADKTNDGIVDGSDIQNTDSETAKESEDIPETGDEDQDADSDADKEDANSEAGGDDSTDDTVDSPDATAPKADEDVVGVADMDLDTGDNEGLGDDNNAGEPEGIQNLLQNGNFEADINEASGWYPPNWTVDSEWNGGFKANQENKDEKNGNYVSWWMAADSESKDISISQTVENVAQGIYMISADVAGEHPAEKFSLKVLAETVDNDNNPKSTNLASIEIAEGTGWSAWDAVYDVFEVSEENAVDIKVYVEGSIGGTDAQSFVLDNVELTLAMPKLEALYDEAKTAKDSGDYTEESVATLETVMEIAKTVIDKDDTETPTADEIQKVYVELSYALNGLVLSKEKTEITLYYYNADVDKSDELGLVFWSDEIASSTADKAEDWEVWNKSPYLLTPVIEYAGWYSISILPVSGSGFEIFKRTDTENSVYKCSSSDGGNGVYSKLVSAKEDTYAVRDYKCYEGKALVKAAMRSVTLYVYSDTDTPALMKENGTLSKIEEDAEGIIKLSELTADDYNDGYNNHYYSMVKDTANPNWYYLTFSVPDTESASDKICALYSKADKDAYEKDLLNGPTSESNAKYSVDLTNVFDGKTYYKDGEFYDSKESAELADGITLGALTTLVDAANELEQSEYTTESWSEFAKALKTATELVTKLTDDGKGDTYKDEGDSTEIADAYNNLDAAMKDLEKKDRIINFSYYAGDTDGKGVGVYTYGSAISSTADPTEWKLWGNPIYEMTATDYFGWYTIPLTFSGSIDDADNKSNFQICIEDKSSAVLICGNTDGEKSKDEYFDIYEELFTGKDDSYAVKKVGDDFKLFKGDAADAVMRNVTLHIYSESGVPAIVLDRANKLSYINESSGTENDLENCTATKIDDWAINCYDMEAVGTTEWYSLSFTVPTPGNDGKFFDLAIKETESGAYTWNAKFVSADSTDTTAPNFKSALKAGKAYYKDGVFYKSLDEIKGITLDDLKALIETTEEIKSKDYTETSWTVFSTALGAAKEVVEKYEDESFEGTVDPTEIKDAYDNLAAAIKGLKEKGRIITFNYYAGDVDEDDEVGIITWDDAISFLDEDGNEAVEATWHPWEQTANIAYTMTPDDDYPGWYSIKIEFGSGWKDSSNIQILKKKRLDVSEFTCNGANLKSMGEGTETSYAVKAYVGENEEKIVNLYKGDSAVTAIKRNVTLYVYSDDGVPAFMTESELKYVDETDGNEKELTTKSFTDSGTYEDNEETKTWYNYYYNMEKEDGQDNWYMLTFIAPYKDETGTYKIGELYTYKGGETPEKKDYTYVAKFHNGTWDNMTAPDIDFTPVFKGDVYFKDGAFSDSRSMSLSALKNLITTAEGIQKGNYSDETWTELTTAITSAKDVVEEIGNKEDSAVTDAEAVKITDAYNELDKAMKGLKEKGNTITFNYYAGDTQGKGVAVYYWSENSNISTTAEPASWKAWNDTTPVYSMTPAQYSGWYTIDLTFAGKATDNANFQILTEADKNNTVFKCGSEASSDNGKNVAIYTEIFGAAESIYAVQKFGSSDKLYKGEAEVSDAMRNVTLYVYSTEGTPAIKSDTELNYIDENDGSKKKLDASDTKTGETDGITWNNYFYNMKQVTDKQNWYELTFIASDTEKTSDKICELYIKTDDEYQWKMNFLNGPVASDQAAWNVDFTPVFSGNAYYNNGKFYSSMDLAEGITLKMLEDLVKSDKITAIVNKGEAGYTTESWTTFDTAYKAADDLVKACREDTEKNSDDYKSDDIKDKYIALSAAADAIVPVIQASVVTLYFYSEDLNEYTDTNTEKYNLYLSTWNNAKISSTKDEVDLSQGEWGYKAYEFEKVTDESINKGFDNWYTVPVKVLAANDGEDGDGFIIQLGKATTQDGETTHQALFSNVAIIQISYWENSSIYAAIANAGDGGVIAIKDGKMYSSIESAEITTLEDLQKLYDEAVALQKTDYLEDDNWSNFQTALKSAKTVLDKGIEATGDEILTAYNALEASMKALVYKTSATIDVKKVALAEDFITGADLSSYVSLKQSGVVFKDDTGKALSDSEFFQYLKDGGTNWVRIRIWNDPYNSNGDGYGGGNSDLDKAKIIGKLATDAGMKVLIDFHYSDFWADPSKQDTPKAWEGHTLEQKEKDVYEYTLNNLKALKDAGVNVGMVQVGNETNNKICGVSGWDGMAKIFSAGSKAVREFDENCLVALHFADPSSNLFDTYANNLQKRNVDYDVFAASYYPFWHGTAEGMYEKLLGIAKDYGKKVMVAETSWVTTWEDGDGHGNTSPKTTQTLNYPVSVQGQADEMVDVISNVNKINEDYPGKAIGVFYWEPAWISPYYVYNAGSRDESLYNKNKEVWEKYGSGWASSYSTEYDPTDAGRWYGGSAVDNQAWFDFNGKALATAKMYSYIRTGASATERRNEIVNVENEIIKRANIGDEIPWPDSNDIVVTFNDGSKSTDKGGNAHLISTTIDWDEDQEALVNTDKAGTFTVDGTVVCTYYVVDGDASTIKSETYDICLTLEVLSTSNILKNAGFENGNDENNWIWKRTLLVYNEAKEMESHAIPKQEDTHDGSWGWHFYSKDAINFTIEQEVSDLKAGTYTVGGFIQGNGAAAKDLQTLYVTVVDSKGSKTTYESTCSLNGWNNWVNPEIANIKVSEGDTLTVGVEIKSTVGGAWGTIDDMYMYGKYGLNLGDIKNGVVNVSNMEADSGEVVRIAAMPENGYYLSKLELTGETVTQNILKDESGLGKAPENATDKKAVLIYNDTENKSDATMQASFVMPEGTVTLNAEFTKVTLESVSMDNVVAKGFKLDGEKYVCETPQEFTGKKIELDLDLSYMGYKLTNADYTAKYKNNVNKTTGDNMAEITVTAKGKKFTGKKTLYFNIDDTKIDISKATAVLTDDDPNKVDTYYYTGAEIEPGIGNQLKDKKTGSTLKTKDGKADLSLDSSDYTIYYQKNIKVGKATMTVIAKNDSSKIKGSFTQTFTIAKRPIADNSGNLANGITIVAPTGGTYTGSKITPNVTVKYGSKELQKGRDYTVTYKNNVNVSKGVTDNNKKPSLKITGKGNYTGVTKEYYFEISAKSISDYGMKAEAEAIAENKAPKITLKNGTKKLTLNKHYRITEILRNEKGDIAEEIIYKCDPVTGSVTKGTKPNVAIKDKGEYTVTLSGIEKGGYTGTQTVDFRVVDKDHLISTAKVTKIPKSLPYTGSEITLGKEDIEVRNSKGGTLTFGDDYTLSYNDVNGNKTNIKAGKVTVTITGEGDYAGTKTAKFTIAKRVVEGGKADGAAANKDKAAITYEVKADTLLDKIAKKTAANSALELPYTGFAWTPELDVYATNGGAKKLLTIGTDYTISYKNNLKPGSEASIIIKGKGNYSGSVTFNKVFTVKDVTLDDFVITINPVEYNGKALKPAINFVYKETGSVVNMKAGTAYAVKYTNNKNVASIESKIKPTVTITEKGLNAKKKGADKGKVNLHFTITTARITAASVSEVKMQTYNGKPSKPALTIKVNGKTLKAGTDYVVTYSGNSRPNDKAIARIIGIGNYSGTVNKTFVIK